MRREAVIKMKGRGMERRGRHKMGHTGDMSVCRLSEVILLGMLIARKQVRNPIISGTPDFPCILSRISPPPSLHLSHLPSNPDGIFPNYLSTLPISPLALNYGSHYAETKRGQISWQGRITYHRFKLPQSPKD